jgi:hypothetical protein
MMSSGRRQNVPGTRSWRCTGMRASQGPKGGISVRGSMPYIKDAARRRFDVVMGPGPVDRLGRSLQDLIAFMQELRSLKIDLFLHQQGSRHHDACRQNDVSNDGRVCRV